MYCLQLISAADYRMPVFNALYERLGPKLKIYTGTGSFEDGIKEAKLDRPYFVEIENVYHAGKRFCIQKGVYHAAVAAEGTILSLNPRTLTNWLIAKKRRSMGKPVVMWGHAWPREGKGAKSDAIRQKMRNMADLLVTYTESQAAELAPMVKVPVVAAPNALYTKQQMESSLGVKRSPNGFLYTGRFVETKKPAVLIRAFAKAVPQLPTTTRLFMVGDGPLKSSLIQEAESLGIKDRVDFPGWVSDFEGLRKFYMQSVTSVSPGYMGLSGTQSFAFGVPMLISRDEPHAPEIEAAEEGKNAVFFETDSEEALAAAMVSAMQEQGQWLAKSDEILNDCMERYSVDVMADRLASAFQFRGRP